MHIKNLLLFYLLLLCSCVSSRQSIKEALLAGQDKAFWDANNGSYNMVFGKDGTFAQYTYRNDVKTTPNYIDIELTNLSWHLEKGKIKIYTGSVLLFEFIVHKSASSKIVLISNLPIQGDTVTLTKAAIQSW